MHNYLRHEHKNTMNSQSGDLEDALLYLTLRERQVIFRYQGRTELNFSFLHHFKVKGKQNN